MIELILGIIVLLGTLGLAFIIIMAAEMSDSPSGSDAIMPLVWTILGAGAAVEVGLFLLWFAKHKGWN